MTEQIKRNQHYVPQSYLSRFTFDKKGVFVFDKLKMRSFVNSIRNIASDNFFYNIPGETLKEIQSVENGWVNLEGHFNTVINSIVQGQNINKNIDRSIKYELARLCVLQLLRTKKFRDNAYERTIEILGDISNDIDTQRQISLHHSSFMFDPMIWRNRAEELTNESWCIIWRNTSRVNFYTSDAPVVRFPYPITLEQVRQGVETVLPLSPRLLVAFYQGKKFSQYRQWDLHYRPIRSALIEHYNRLQIEQSHRQIYSFDGAFDRVPSVLQSQQ